MTQADNEFVIISANKKKEVVYKASVLLKDKSVQLKIYSHDGRFQESRSFPKTNSWKILT